MAKVGGIGSVVGVAAAVGTVSKKVAATAGKSSSKSSPAKTSTAKSSSGKNTKTKTNNTSNTKTSKTNSAKTNTSTTQTSNKKTQNTSATNNVAVNVAAAVAKLGATVAVGVAGAVVTAKETVNTVSAANSTVVNGASNAAPNQKAGNNTVAENKSSTASVQEVTKVQNTTKEIANSIKETTQEITKNIAEVVETQAQEKQNTATKVTVGAAVKATVLAMETVQKTVKAVSENITSAVQKTNKVIEKAEIERNYLLDKMMLKWYHKNYAESGNKENSGKQTVFGVLPFVAGLRGLKPNDFTYKIPGGKYGNRAGVYEKIDWETKKVTSWSAEDYHKAFGTLSFIPVLGDPFDIADATLYYVEGDKATAATIMFFVCTGTDEIRDGQRMTGYFIENVDEKWFREALADGQGVVGFWNSKFISNAWEKELKQEAAEKAGKDSVIKGGLDTIFKGGKVSIDDIKANPKAFSGKTVEEIADVLRNSGYDVTIKKSAKSKSGAQIIKVNNPGGGKNISQVQVSPGGGRHGELPYVKISTTDQGKIKIVDGLEEYYKTDGEETATIIFSGGN